LEQPERRVGHSEDAVRDGLVSLREAARFLAVSRTSIYGLLTSGLLPSVKIGKSRRVPRRSLLAFAAERLERNL
jgi:excisionase family DNA binding protein